MTSLLISSPIQNKYPCKPFLKWAGGKGRLLPELLKRVPSFFGSYFEPFIGGGALYFSLQPQSAFISDINFELINCYKTVRDNVEILLISLENHIHNREYFYNLREVDRSTEFGKWSLADRASRLIYLNKTCFNGLFRVNSKGFFNVPFGQYKNPRIVNAENMRACSQALRYADIRDRSFLEIEADVKTNDFIYFDPPYVPVNSTSSFTSYSAEGFNGHNQLELYELCTRLDKKGAKFMLSNSSVPFVLDLYRSFSIDTVTASRSINSEGNKRGKISEVIIRNF